MRLIIATILAFTITSSVFATAPVENPIVTLEKVGDNKFQLKYMEIPEGKVTVAIKDKSNRIIFRDVIEAEKVFYKNYNLNKLDIGKYQLEVFNGKDGKLSGFDIVLGDQKEEKTFYAKMMEVDDKTLALTMSNLNGKEKTLEIYDNGSLIHEEAITGLTFGKKFKFTNLESLKNIDIKIVEGNGVGKYIFAN
ncbi:hypothetical protein [Cyclobacterium marinum]|uniref:Secreted protein n=1 Tax=Cyclobacterium marinum (strain ATCC 25205 / DSM 745 / LMG 13164 / NCIMB 1802) TaxID=880070 RepID=G0J3E7_CYCMS|nr:hypothetical protein [Cyclobacterium marinum]AEL24586.1 hypothetical protein Cycma_0812 [Cyclobacterium marinum DSM 745]MBI0399244.1 hypothetical protein [Cyclobacterium marinum]MBR9774917.1 hypothetical protein [Cytophagales bacterium]|tara:strand:- start:97649 stop:98227 length:579 start_codon:yes stop_codon:yes gene_type:complete